MLKLYLIASLLLFSHTCSMAIAGVPGFPGKGNEKTWQKATVFYNQGIDLSHSKEYEKAAKKYRQAIAIYPYDANFFNNLSFVLERTANSKGGEVAARKAISLQPTAWGAWENLGNCLYDQNKFQESKAAYTQALQCSPPSSRRADFQTVISTLDRKIKEEKAKGL
jgi:tetratricopeptide (TPR) repeat protein